MKRNLRALLAAGMMVSLSMAAVSCGPVEPNGPSHKTHTQTISVKHLPNGRWAYQGDDDMWFYYYILSADGSRNYYTGQSFPSVGSTTTDGGPVGSSSGVVEIGQAAQGEAPTETEVASAEAVSVEIEVTAEGSPASQAEIAESEAESASEASEGSSESASSESSGSESSSDSGASSSPSDSGSSGGDSGGGGGDGGGGGGD
jgi:hypothetical protein